MTTDASTRLDLLVLVLRALPPPGGVIDVAALLAQDEDLSSNLLRAVLASLESPSDASSSSSVAAEIEALSALLRVRLTQQQQQEDPHTSTMTTEKAPAVFGEPDVMDMVDMLLADGLADGPASGGGGEGEPGAGADDGRRDLAAQVAHDDEAAKAAAKVVEEDVVRALEGEKEGTGLMEGVVVDFGVVDTAEERERQKLEEKQQEPDGRMGELVFLALVSGDALCPNQQGN